MSSQNTPANRLLTEKEVEEIYGLNARTLQAHRQRGGGIPFVKIGAMVRYRPADIEAFVAASVRQNTSQQGAA